MEKSPVRVLLVEDFKPFRQVILSLLGRRRELQVIGEAEDGLEGLAQARQFRPDLILMDIGLPKLDGVEAARRIRELVPSAKIVFVTQETDPEYVEEALTIGALGYVFKSRLETDLLPAIDKVLTGQRFVSGSLGFDKSVEAKPRGRHEILFCPDEAAFLDGLTRFIAAALNAGNAALVLLSPSRHESIRQRLSAQGVDIHAAIRQRTYACWDADETPDGTEFFEAIRSLREAASLTGNKHPRVALCGERTYRMWAEGRTDEVIRLEQFCSDLATNHGVDILCPYPKLKDDKDDAAFTRIWAEHSEPNSG